MKELILPFVRLLRDSVLYNSGLYDNEIMHYIWSTFIFSRLQVTLEIISLDLFSSFVKN